MLGDKRSNSIFAAPPATAPVETAFPSFSTTAYRQISATSRSASAVTMTVLSAEASLMIERISLAEIGSAPKVG